MIDFIKICLNFLKQCFCCCINKHDYEEIDDNIDDVLIDSTSYIDLNNNQSNNTSMKSSCLLSQNDNLIDYDSDKDDYKESKPIINKAQNCTKDETIAIVKPCYIELVSLTEAYIQYDREKLEIMSSNGGDKKPHNTYFNMNGYRIM